ncbi:uncharacterized protein [Diadema setosum]|uniref:uncharacterized protein n=1 Tax=Diadema setosum TaxID=31175 RepID=UPI003B3A88A8
MGNPDWAPTQNMGHQGSDLGTVAASVRHERARQRKRKAEAVEAASTLLSLQVMPLIDNGEEHELPVDDVSLGTEVQTDFLATDISSLEERVQQLEKDNIYLRAQLQDAENRAKLSSLQEQDFKDNNSKLKFYTGLPSWQTFMALFTLITTALPRCRKLTKFEQVLMFLMKLRLNLFDDDIAYRFRVSQSTVSQNFHRMLDIFFVRTQSLIHWPSRESLRMSMPTSFRKFFHKCVIIMDCTEVFIEQPSDLLARAHVWSNYKHHSTVKFLIGITPQGSVCFVSRCWGGRATDTEITQNSNLIDRLTPGDLILADRGFFVNEYCGMAMAEVKVPPFTRGKKQLEKVDVDWSRELSGVRIHVERVIGMVKQKYTILQNRIPINLIRDESSPQATVSKIVRVACALVNLCPSVVPLE